MSTNEGYLSETLYALKTWTPVADDRTNFQNESGIYDPTTRSLVKIRRNGSVDIFAGTNEGIRLDPNNHRISLLTSDFQVRLAVWGLQASDQISMEAVEAILLKTQGNLTLEAEGTITLKAGQIVLDTPDLVGALKEG